MTTITDHVRKLKAQDRAQAKAAQATRDSQILAEATRLAAREAEAQRRQHRAEGAETYRDTAPLIVSVLWRGVLTVHVALGHGDHGRRQTAEHALALIIGRVTAARTQVANNAGNQAAGLAADVQVDTERLIAMLRDECRAAKQDCEIEEWAK